MTVPTYRVTIDRAVRFQLDIEAESRLDALKKVTDTAMVYDEQDLKETRVINIQELIQHTPD
jgi:head-tail adaptor